MGKLIKNNLGNFLVICLIFLMVVGWIFSGWPQIWQKPRIPPTIQKVEANTERQSPDAIVTQTNLTGTITNIQDDPDSPDGNWWTAGVNVSTIAHISFPTPTGNPTTGAGLQEFRILLRKTATNNGKTDDTYTIHLYEDGVLRQSTIASGGNTPTGGVVVSATWDAANLTSADGSGVEVYISTTPEAGGAPTSRGSIEVGAVEWNVDYTTGYLYFSVDSGSQAFPDLTPGTLVATTSILQVRTDNSTGFNITVERDDADTTMDLDTDAAVNIPDKTEWIAPTATTTAGNATASTTEPQTLQFRVRQSGTETPNYASTWWGTDDTTTNALFAGFASSTAPTANKRIIDRSTAATASTTSYVLYNLDVPTSQNTGAYSGSITYTATANP